MSDACFKNDMPPDSKWVGMDVGKMGVRAIPILPMQRVSARAIPGLIGTDWRANDLPIYARLFLIIPTQNLQKLLEFHKGNLHKLYVINLATCRRMSEKWAFEDDRNNARFHPIFRAWERGKKSGGKRRGIFYPFSPVFFGPGQGKKTDQKTDPIAHPLLPDSF